MTPSKQPELPALTEEQFILRALEQTKALAEMTERCLSAERELAELKAAYEQVEPDGTIVGFGCDPRDSAALLELREAIDDCGWANEVEAEAADYAQRVRQLMKAERSLSEVKAERDELKAKVARLESMLRNTEELLADAREPVGLPHYGMEPK